MPKAVARKLQLPVSCTDEEKRALWERHNPGDYLASTRPAQVQISRRLRERVREHKQNLTLRVEPSRVHEIKAVAEERGVPYQTLMRMWIFERLRRKKVG